MESDFPKLPAQRGLDCESSGGSLDHECGSPSDWSVSDRHGYLQSEYESIVQNLHSKFPNLKLAYFTSKFYDAYSNGVSGSNPEPYAYESGFAVKWAIQDQINGNANLNYDPANGPVMAPWMAWGPYDWTNGLLGRSDGLVWSCQDVTFDGVHPSKTGAEAESNFLLNFLKSDTTATPWFLAH